MTDNTLEESIGSYLWYFVPGTIFLAPILLTYGILFNLGKFPDAILIMLAFTAGYIIHGTFRLISHKHYLCGKKPSIQYFNRKLKEIGIDVDDEVADCIYNYYFYSNNKYNDKVSDIKRKSFFNVARGVVALSFALGAIAMLVPKLIVLIKENIVFVIYTLLAILFYLRWLCLDNNINIREKLLIELNPAEIEEIKKMKNRINRFAKENMHN